MILEKICQLYQKNLLSNRDILRYIRDRGINNKSIIKHRLGYCNNNITSSSFPHNKELLEQGIIREKNGEEYDLFNNRITIPILINNTPVFFTSRLYPERGSKIKHLHQSGQIKYAINYDIIRKSNTIVLVEGPFDCFILDQYGIPTIGVLGANRINKDLLESLKSKNIFICFDSEPNNTGDKAALRLAKKISTLGTKSKIINLPKTNEKVDVNSFFLKNDKKEFLKLVKTATLYNIKEKSTKSTPSFKYKNSLPIIKVAKKYLELIYSGGRYKAVCPFHHESDPSIVFYESTNTYFCFGCGAYGGTISLVQKIEESRGNKITKKQSYAIIKGLI